MENSDRRNPYLILGLAYGSSRAEATKALARRSKAARRDPEFPFSMEDLTWALNQIEAQIDNPESSIDVFRVPADPGVLEIPPGPGLLRIPPTPIERRTKSPTTTELDFVNEIVFAEIERQWNAETASKMQVLLDIKPGGVRGRVRPKITLKPRRGFLGF